MADLIESVHRANAELCAFQMRWDIDGDYIRCRKCKQPQLSTYANEAFMHAEKCRNDPVRDVHPWVTYLELLAPIAAHLNVAAWNTRHGAGDADHSPDAGKMGEAEERLHDSIRTVYDAVPSLPIDETTMDAATDALHAFCLLVGIHKIDIDTPRDDAARARERG